MALKQILVAAVLAAAFALPASAADACPVLDHGGWHAAIESDGGRAKLVVAGRVTLPDAGWTAGLREGPMTRSLPPHQILVLVAKRGEGMAAQVLTERDVRIELPAQPAYRAVRIVCGETLLKEFKDIRGG